MAVARGTGRPQRYKIADGTVVPSVTTITGRYKESSGLIGWAYNRGRDGLPRYDDSADIGSVIHKLIEGEVHGDFAIEVPDYPDEWNNPIDSAINAWREWLGDTKLEIIATEIPIVSEEHKFGGTLDAVARDRNGKLCLLDWKSSNAIYSEYLLQLAAYKHLWDETHDELISGGFRVVRISKSHGDLEFRYFPQLNEAWACFYHLRQAYELEKGLRKRV